MPKIIIILLFTSLLWGTKSTDKQFTKLTEDYFKEVISNDPERAASLGIPEDLGIPLNEAKLTDRSPKRVEFSKELREKYDAKLKAIRAKELSPQNKLIYDIFTWEHQDQKELEAFKYHSYARSHMFNFQESLTSLFTEYHLIENEDDVKNYLSRLKAIEGSLNSLHFSLDARDKAGILPPAKIIEIFRWQLMQFIGQEKPSPETSNLAPEKNVFYTHLREKLTDLKLSQEKINSYLLEAKMTISNSVFPAYGKMIDRLSTDFETAKKNSYLGVWGLPNGDAYYKACLKMHTTTDLTAEEIHQLGLKEIKRIQKEMIKLFKELEITGKDFAEMESKWWQLQEKNPGNIFPNTEEGKKEAIAHYMQIIKDAEARLPELFSILPKAKVIAKRVPDYQSAGAHYKFPSFDGKRPGIFYMGMKYPPRKQGMQTLTYHEAVPGHHLQIALQSEMKQHKYFRSLLFYTGYIEGWALYAEKLARENEWYTDIHSLLGNLSSELFRAVRLALDTGIHYKRWTYEEAAEFGKKNLGWEPKWEIYRYAVWPGQACAYKIGELKILELRKKMKEALGENFDIKEFHKIVLEDGSMPLEILEKKVNDYIELKTKS